MTEIIITIISSLLIGGGIGFCLARRAGPSLADLQSAREDKVRAETKLQAQEEIRKDMENTFKAMAGDIAAANSRTFLEQANEKFKALADESERELDGKKKLIDQSLSGMNRQLETIHKQSVELKTSIDESHRVTNSLSENTVRLREVLSSPQKRGKWGERVVTDMLELIGLFEGTNYTHHTKLESGRRPDFTFILPRGKKLNMDVKFPLANYDRYISADSTDDSTRKQAKNDFLRDVKGHIKDVSGREYINRAENTLDYVMLFIPYESIYGFIHKEDSNLIDNAMKQGVLLCSPMTLYAMLSLIHQATRDFLLNERASEVMDQVEQFRAQWKKYVEQMGKLGKGIDKLSVDYNNLVTTRTRQLEKPLDKIQTIALPGPDSAAGGDAPELLPRGDGEL